jgi:hypothetical protein
LGRFNTFDTVPVDTPARAATSLIVTEERRRGPRIDPRAG